MAEQEAHVLQRITGLGIALLLPGFSPRVETEKAEPATGATAAVLKEVLRKYGSGTSIYRTYSAVTHGTIYGLMNFMKPGVRGAGRGQPLPPGLLRVGRETVTMLELGCGYGNTAAVAARGGFRVTGVDISDIRLEFARQHANAGGLGSPRFVRADFYSFEAAERFDVICYWNGFGIGTDADQRRLLRLIGEQT